MAAKKLKKKVQIEDISNHWQFRNELCITPDGKLTQMGEDDIKDGIERLLRLYQETHPGKGKASEKDKFKKAQQAIIEMAFLQRFLAGWAIEHFTKTLATGDEGATRDTHAHEPTGYGADDREYKASAVRNSLAQLIGLSFHGHELPTALADSLILFNEKIPSPLFTKPAKRQKKSLNQKEKERFYHACLIRGVKGFLKISIPDALQKMPTVVSYDAFRDREKEFNKTMSGLPGYWKKITASAQVCGESLSDILHFEKGKGFTFLHPRGEWLPISGINSGDKFACECRLHSTLRERRVPKAGMFIEILMGGPQFFGG